MTDKILFKTEENKDDEIILQPVKVWCEDCQDWVENVERKDNYLCCYQCGNGLVMII